MPVVPTALSCPAAADARSKLLPLAGCAANLNTAVYDFMTNSWRWYLRRTSMRAVHGLQFEYIHPMHRSDHVISNHQSGIFGITRMHHVIRMILMQIHECIRMEFRLLLHKYQLLVINSYNAVLIFAAQPASGILAAGFGCS